MSKYNQVLIVDEEITGYVYYKMLRRLNFSNHILVKNSVTQALKYLQLLSKSGHFCPEVILYNFDMLNCEEWRWKFLEELGKFDFPNKSRVTLCVLTADTSLLNTGWLSGSQIRVIEKPLSTEGLVEMLVEASAI